MGRDDESDSEEEVSPAPYCSLFSSGAELLLTHNAPPLTRIPPQVHEDDLERPSTSRGVPQPSPERFTDYVAESPTRSGNRVSGWVDFKDFQEEGDEGGVVFIESSTGGGDEGEEEEEDYQDEDYQDEETEEYDEEDEEQEVEPHPPSRPLPHTHTYLVSHS